MNYFRLIVYISFGLWVIRNVLFWVGLWQDKEYRLDRLIVHVKETLQGRHIFFSYGNFLKWIFFFLYGLAVFYESYLNLYENILGVFFIYQAIIVLKDLFDHHLKRPTFTAKAVFLVISSISIISLFLLFPLMSSFVWLIVVDLMLSVVFAVFVFFLSFPPEFY